MPPAVKPATPLASDLRAGRLRVLQLLAALPEGRSLSRARLGDPPRDVLDGLLGGGLLEEHDLEVCGVSEVAFSLTSAGRASLNGVAAPMVRPVEELEMPAITSIVPAFGSNRASADLVGEACRGLKWVGVPFCGSLPEVPAMLRAGVNAVALNDRHGHLVNLARVLSDGDLGPKAYRALRRKPLCLKTLRESQEYCLSNEPQDEQDLEAACHYFVSAWMGRSAASLTSGEFKAAWGARYSGSGGNSALRYANAVGGIRAWRKILERCSFSCEDAFRFLARANDREDGGIFCDPPWVTAGMAYRYNFGEDEEGLHALLADKLESFSKARVILRIGGHPLIEKLYPRSTWRWLAAGGRTQANEEKVEWLIVKNGRE